MKYRKQEPKFALPQVGTKSMWQFIKHFLDDIKIDLFHSSILLSGNIATQLIAVLAYPVLTRLYSASQFGEFSLFLSITGILAIISTGRLEYALILADNDEETLNITRIGVRWCFIFSVLCFIISLFLAKLDYFGKKIPGLNWIGLYVFLSGIIQIFVIYRNRQKQYKALAKITLLQTATSSGIKIVLGLLNLLSQGLIWGNIVGQLAGALAVTKGYVKQTFKEKPASIKATLQKYSAFPKYRMIQAVINSLSSNLPIFFIAYYYSSREAGFFALIVGIGYRIIVLISQALYQVLYQKFAELKRLQKPILPIFQKIVFLLFMISFVPGIVIFIFATPLVSWFFGSGWIETGIYIRIILPWLILVLMVSPFAFIADIFSLQKTALFFDIIHLLIRIVALFIGLMFHNVHLSVSLFSLCSITFLLSIMIWYHFILKNNNQNNLVIKGYIPL